MKKSMLVLVMVIGMLAALASVSRAEERYNLKGCIKSMDTRKSEIAYLISRVDRERTGLPRIITVELRKHDIARMRKYFDKCKEREPERCVEAWVQVVKEGGKYVAKSINPPAYCWG